MLSHPRPFFSLSLSFPLARRNSSNNANYVISSLPSLRQMALSFVQRIAPSLELGHNRTRKQVGGGADKRLAEGYKRDICGRKYLRMQIKSPSSLHFMEHLNTTTT